jgi:hypothetical protein
MNLFKKTTENVNYVTAKKEFDNKVRQIHIDELQSEKYKKVCEYLSKNYYARRNEELETNLLKVVGTYEVDYNVFNKARDVKKKLINNRYSNLKNFMSSLSADEINSNIFLKSAYDFMNMSEEVCGEIMLLLQDTVNNGEPKDISMSMPKKMGELIPDYAEESIGIPYHNPAEYKTAYINFLDAQHEHIYKEYNYVVQTIGKIAEDICFFKLNEMTLNKPDLECYHFQVYLPGDDNSLIARFFTNSEIKKDWYYTDEYVAETISNFKELLDAGIIDISVLEKEKIIQK